MKIIFFLTVLLTNLTYGKKVKFAVDMAGETIHPAGIHVTGDFQVLAGFGTEDWSSSATPLIQLGASTIYSIVVDIPAFRKYEYKFVNGDQFYQAEFVPEISRVGYDFNDNRWIYVDSLSPDTFFVGAIGFGKNAPAGLQMVRYKVDMNGLANLTNVHVAGTFNNWDYRNSILYSFVDKIFEVINYAPAGSYEYKFANGSTTSGAETVTGGCVNFNGNRKLLLQSDTVLETVCFGTCAACITSVKSDVHDHSPEVFPNPVVSGRLFIHSVNPIQRVEILDPHGKLIFSEANYNESELQVEILSSGVYLVKVHGDGKVRALRFVSR